jgi:hypothetical protein
VQRVGPWYRRPELGKAAAPRVVVPAPLALVVDKASLRSDYFPALAFG